MNLSLHPEAVEAFIGYVTGCVIELETVSQPGESRCVVVQGQDRTTDGWLSVRVRRFDDDLGQPIGEAFVVPFDEVVGVTVY